MLTSRRGVCNAFMAESDQLRRANGYGDDRGRKPSASITLTKPHFQSYNSATSTLGLRRQMKSPLSAMRRASTSRQHGVLANDGMTGPRVGAVTHDLAKPSHRLRPRTRTQDRIKRAVVAQRREPSRAGDGRPQRDDPLRYAASPRRRTPGAAGSRSRARSAPGRQCARCHGRASTGLCLWLVPRSRARRPSAER